MPDGLERKCLCPATQPTRQRLGDFPGAQDLFSRREFLEPRFTLPDVVAKRPPVTSLRIGGHFSVFDKIFDFAFHHRYRKFRCLERSMNNRIRIRH